MRVAVVRGVGHRAGRIAKALMVGIPLAGDEAIEVPVTFYNGPDMDGAAYYGLRGRCLDAFRDYRRKSFVAYVDLGYWGRRDGGTYSGFHKVSVNDRHPTAYFQKRAYPSDRFDHHRITIKPWKKDGKHVLIAGMGAKAAPIEGFKPNEWEIAAAKEIRRYTDRPIVYRPKPSWREAIPIDGTIFSDRSQSLNEALQDCWAVVSHHSNVCVDALIEGIPVFCYHGVAKPMGLQEIALIEQPLYPDDRHQWCCNIAYTQWTPSEMASGAMWAHLKQEGIVP